MSENYKPNSHKSKATPDEEKSKEGEKKIQKIVTGEVTRRKKSLGRRIAETFTGDDARSVGQYILFDVIIPASKTMISDALSQGVERALFGESRRSNIRSGRPTYTSYNRISSPRPFEEPRREVAPRAETRGSTDIHDIVLADRAEAEAVIDGLSLIVDQYDVVTVQDLLELVGVTGSYTDNRWGWYDLRGAGVRRIRDGYLLELPRVSPVE